jgi:hypothetical protein
MNAFWNSQNLTLIFDFGAMFYPSFESLFFWILENTMVVFTDFEFRKYVLTFNLEWVVYCNFNLIVASSDELESEYWTLMGYDIKPSI